MYSATASTSSAGVWSITNLSFTQSEERHVMLSTRTEPFALIVKGVDVAKNPGPFLEGLEARG